MLDTCRLDGRGPDEQLLTDVRIAGTACDGGHHFALAVGQALDADGQRRVDRQPFRELTDEPPGDGRSQQRPAIGHRADGGHELGRRDVLGPPAEFVDDDADRRP